MRASNEAQSAFGDGAMFIEKYVEDPRHIEIQVRFDRAGVHFVVYYVPRSSRRTCRDNALHTCERRMSMF